MQINLFVFITVNLRIPNEITRANVRDKRILVFMFPKIYIQMMWWKRKKVSWYFCQNLLCNSIVKFNLHILSVFNLRIVCTVNHFIHRWSIVCHGNRKVHVLNSWEKINPFKVTQFVTTYQSWWWYWLMDVWHTFCKIIINPFCQRVTCAGCNV